MLFRDRVEAGEQLAEALRALRGEDVVVLGIPRGGIVVAERIATALRAPLDVFIAHKLGAPDNSELAIGAVASDGTVFIATALVETLGVSASYVERETALQETELRRRLEIYRLVCPAQPLEGRVAVLVDDGVATGATISAAVSALRKRGCARIIIAVPVGPGETIERLRGEADAVVCLAIPDPFWAVGRFFRVWDQVSDAEVVRLLEASRGGFETRPHGRTCG